MKPANHLICFQPHATFDLEPNRYVLPHSDTIIVPLMFQVGPEKYTDWKGGTVEEEDNITRETFVCGLCLVFIQDL